MWQLSKQELLVLSALCRARSCSSCGTWGRRCLGGCHNLEFLPFESLLSPDWSCMLAALQQMQRVRSLGAARLTAKLFLLSAANGCISRPG